ncbi:hypothetical protein BKA67DRAFT_536894 [Truncatella angustata]|uniref:Uncharacterized protein n=1 Tax=Truncatella angustata TaxID=152316 RepID=A0A9P8UJ95_9PEZI|nr:uncharacterized protein BKA67DRAFT_536894 [Truncatella angustata]KAH6653202.1 hypothetical protein BKA67DRAFT_536894 [Truncatella angustata]
MAVAGVCATPSNRNGRQLARGSQSLPRTTGSGPNAVLTADLSASHGRIQSATTEDTIMAEADGVYGTCLVPTNTTVSDCQAVLGDIAAFGDMEGSNGTISVAPGFCLNWWEGTCQGRVCGRNSGLSASSDWIVETMESSILDTCITKGQTGVVADCSDWTATCVRLTCAATTDAIMRLLELLSNSSPLD